MWDSTANRGRESLKILFAFFIRGIRKYACFERREGGWLKANKNEHEGMTMLHIILYIHLGLVKFISLERDF